MCECHLCVLLTGQCCKQRKTEDELKDRELTACQVHVDYGNSLPFHLSLSLSDCLEALCRSHSFFLNSIMKKMNYDLSTVSFHSD